MSTRCQANSAGKGKDGVPLCYLAGANSSIVGRHCQFNERPEILGMHVVLYNGALSRMIGAACATFT